MITEIRASAPGKIILSGEHFVVHGSYSVAAAINKRVYVSVREINGKDQIVSNDISSNLDSDDGSFPAVKSVTRNILSIARNRKHSPFEISISSEIPSGSGLGSSAAVSVACSAALSEFLGIPLNKEEISNLAFKGESTVHGNPSGLDIQACQSGGLIVFKKSFETRSIHLKDPVRLLVVFSGRKRSTSKLIAKVADRRTEYPNQFQRLVDSASSGSFEMVDALKSRDLSKIGSLFTSLQVQLSWIGVSTPQLDDLIEFLYKKQEVLGAKLTGAGGGGSIIAAIKSGSEDSVLKYVSSQYPYSFVTEIPQEGLRWEKATG